MKKLTSILKFVGVMLFIIISIYIMNTFTTSTTSANNDSSKNFRLMRENFELKTKYNEVQEELNKIKTNLFKINYYDKYIYTSINGINPDSNFLTNYYLSDIRYGNLDNSSIFKLIDNQTLSISQMVTSELMEIQNVTEIINNISGYPNMSPIRTKNFIMLTSKFGWRIHPIFKTGIFHDGVDISANIGSPVYATASGKVDFVMYSKYGYGNRIVIKHANGYETLYAHLGRDIRVRKGWRVKKGDRIGSVGNTGRSTGPHLHYEVRHNDKLKDPLAYFYTYMIDKLLANNELN